jgi:hypothetical protein
MKPVTLTSARLLLDQPALADSREPKPGWPAP